MNMIKDRFDLSSFIQCIFENYPSTIAEITSSDFYFGHFKLKE
jgi:hypothetical protein